MSGKRKADDGVEEENTHGSTLFISNLSYSTTTEALQAAFDDLAPVRSCFVVYEKSPVTGVDAASGKGKSKGVGYVTFAIKEDAESVAKRYNSDVVDAQPLFIDGRKVRIKWADRKPIAHREASDAPPPVKKPRKEPRVSQASIVHDPIAIRTLVVTNLAKEGLTNGILWKKIRKYDGAESVVWPVEEDATVAHVIFKTPVAASAALAKLHSHLYKGAILSVVLKKRSDSLIKSDSAHAALKSAKPSRGGRLIIRNLPWNITADDLRALFTPHGAIHSVHIPTVSHPPDHDTPSISTPPTATKKPLARGFAFVWFLSKQDAARAISRVNGAKVYGGYAVDKAAAAANKIAGRKEISKKKNEENARVIAVDWALSKDKWKEVNPFGENAEGDDEKGSIHGGEEEEEDNDEDGESSSTSQDEEDGDDVDDDAIRGSVPDTEADGHSATSDQTGHPPPPAEGTTLFIRNVPFEATDDDLKELFRAFGPLRYARVTMDYDSSRSRGTGFVCFWNLADANACLEESDRMREDLDVQLTAKKNPFTLLTLDPSSSRAARLVLQGRTLDVTRAVSRDRAETLRETGERARERKDKRNLYLMREGVIFASTPSASSLAKAELERRQQSFTMRRQLLRSNPALYISRTRLSIRNLPIWVSERGLKRLAIHAIRAFEEEVKQDVRAPLATDELEAEASDVLPVPANAKEGKKSTGKQAFWKKTERKTGVKQAKIVRQADRIDPLTGKGRSKGYGFLELERHEDALRVLRWANNNRGAQGLMWAGWRKEIGDIVDRLERDLKANKGEKKEEREENEARLKKLKVRMEEMQHSKETIKDGRTLLVEFSIENISVVKRRSGREAEVADARAKSPDGSRPNKKRLADNEIDTASSPPPAKKPKRSIRMADDGSVKVGRSIGGLIGKKRKERRKNSIRS